MLWPLDEAGMALAEEGHVGADRIKCLAGHGD